MRHQLPFALMLAASACFDRGEDLSTEEVAAALEQENGGFDMADEAPMFGEQAQYQAAALEGDVAVADPMAADPEVTTIARDLSQTGERLRVLIAWGRMPADPDATTGRDWSGSLTVSRGAVVVLRTLGFEEATDRVLPRTSRDRIDFESRTRPFVDGLALRVLDPDRAAAEPLLLAYDGRDGTHHDIDLRGVQGPQRIDLPDGNRVIIVVAREQDDCNHGFVRGRWRALREHAGVYRGLVANADGEVQGHIRGIWGRRQNGERVMFGKFIDRDGRFMGILRGTYDDGRFEARWLVRSGDHGILRGLAFQAPNVRGGVFVGRWDQSTCAK